MSLSKSKFIQVGKIGRPKGTKGLLRLYCFLNDDRDINKFGSFYLEDESTIKIKIVSFDKKSPIININNIDNRTDVEFYVNKIIFLQKEKLNPTKENEYYFHDLENLDVINNKNEIVGRVVSVVNFGAGDLLEIYFQKSSKNEFFRFTEQNFPSVNISEKKITIKS